MNPGKHDSRQAYIPEVTFEFYNPESDPQGILDPSNISTTMPGGIIEDLAPPSVLLHQSEDTLHLGFSTIPHLMPQELFEHNSSPLTTNSSYGLFPLSCMSAPSIITPHPRYHSTTTTFHDTHGSRSTTFHDISGHDGSMLGHSASTFETNFHHQRNKRHPSPATSTSHRSYSSSEEGGCHGSSFMDDQAKRSRRCGSTSNSHHYTAKKKSCAMSPNLEKDRGVEKDDDSRTYSSCTGTPPDGTSKKQNHSEIEKRRRDKMNTYITELSRIVPVCGVSSRKLDKLTVLRMAVEHMKTIRGSQLNSYTEGQYKPSYISDSELKNLLLKAADGFLFVVGCDRGRLLYVSESVTQVLNYHQSDLLGQSWFDILHPKDVAKVKEQLNDLAPREKLLIDIRTMLPVKGNTFQHHWGSRFCPGARRAFFCRMKCKPSVDVKPESKENDLGGSDDCHGHLESNDDASRERKYSLVYCTGYMKPWSRSEKPDVEGDKMEDEDSCNLSCLIAVGRILPSLRYSSMTSQVLTFSSRHAADGKFVFIDQRATLVLGFLPQELIGSSMYDYYHAEDASELSHLHKVVLATTNPAVSAQTTPIYRFRTSDSSYLILQSEWSVFRNPYTRDFECLIATNMLVSPDDSNFDNLKQSSASINEDSYNSSHGFPDDIHKDIHGTCGAAAAPAVLKCGSSLLEATPGTQEGMFPSLTGLSRMTPSAVSNFLSSSIGNHPAGTYFTTLAPIVTASEEFKPFYPLPNISEDIILPGPSTSLSLTTIQPRHEMLYNMAGSEGDHEQSAIEACPITEVGNEDAAMAVIMSLLEGESGTPEPPNLSWTLT